MEFLMWIPAVLCFVLPLLVMDRIFETLDEKARARRLVPVKAQAEQASRQRRCAAWRSR